MYVAERNMIRMSIPEGLELVRRAGILKGATRVHIRQDHDLFRRQNFRGFRHEADAAEGDDIRIGRLRLVGKVQAVAYEICEILDLWRSEDHTSALQSLMRTSYAGL